MSDAKNMSFAEIQKRIQEMDAERVVLEAALHAKRGEEIKVLADAYAKKLQAGGFSIAEGIKALAPYGTIPAKRTDVAPRPPREVETGTTYKNLETGETWTAGAKGRVVGWLQAQINAGKSAASFATGANGPGTGKGEGASATGTVERAGGDRVGNG
jgi:DNA-binding protein H-NS